MNTQLLKYLLAAINITNPKVEFDSMDSEDDTIIVNDFEYIYDGEDGFTVGHLVYYPGNRHEPPETDYIEREILPSFHLAAKALVLHLAEKNIQDALEVMDWDNEAEKESEYYRQNCCPNEHAYDGQCSYFIQYHGPNGECPKNEQEADQFHQQWLLRNKGT